MVGGAGDKLADTTAGIPKDITQHVGSVTGDAGGRSDGPAASGHPARSPGAGAPAGTPGAKVRSVEPNQAPPLRRSVAYVWPAIALGPFGELLTGLPASSPSMSDAATRLLSGVTPSMVATSSASPPEHSTGPGASASDIRGIALPGGGEIPFFVLVISAAALTALLVTAVRRELGSVYRWWPH